MRYHRVVAGAYVKAPTAQSSRAVVLPGHEYCSTSSAPYSLCETSESRTKCTHLPAIEAILRVKLGLGLAFVDGYWPPILELESTFDGIKVSVGMAPKTPSNVACDLERVPL